MAGSKKSARKRLSASATVTAERRRHDKLQRQLAHDRQEAANDFDAADGYGFIPGDCADPTEH